MSRTFGAVLRMELWNCKRLDSACLAAFSGGASFAQSRSAHNLPDVKLTKRIIKLPNSPLYLSLCYQAKSNSVFSTYFHTQVA